VCKSDATSIVRLSARVVNLPATNGAYERKGVYFYSGDDVSADGLPVYGLMVSIRQGEVFKV
jgi:hypothetical protein